VGHVIGRGFEGSDRAARPQRRNFSGAAKFEPFGRTARIRLFARSIRCPTGEESLRWLPGQRWLLGCEGLLPRKWRQPPMA
jgi:hypothetical protein